MKIGLMTITLAGLLLSFTRDVQAQAYDLSYYWDGAQYQQYSPQQNSQTVNPPLRMKSKLWNLAI